MGQKGFFSSYERSFYLILRIVLGAVFIWASWNKILEPQSFAQIIYNYQILPPAMVNPLAILLPWMEAVCGICLISGYLVKGSVLVVDILMIIFIMVLTFNVYRGVDVACGCFSVSDLGEKITFLKILRDLPLLAVGIWILYYRIKTDRNGSGNRKVV
ncbi:MAG: DoxX family membrane protein [Deltaproteobacteria bacterium]|nr:MAG: DoxX family membrane protein [Deltaproteobacteria bacterium]